MNHEPMTRLDILRRIGLVLVLGCTAQWIGTWFQVWKQ